MANEKLLIDANELKRRMIAFATAVKTGFLSIEAIIDRIDTAQTVDAVEVVHGRWRMETDDEEPNPMFKLPVCCVCGKTGGMTDYCPNCGAKMDGDA